MKRLRGVLLITILTALVLILINFISAATNAEVLFGSLGEGIQALFEGVSPLAISNFSRILLGILVWMVLYSVVKEIGIFETSGPVWTGIVALIVTVLSFTLIPSELVTAILVPYGALGATIATILPFLILIYFTVFVTDSLFVARLILLVFVLYYFSICAYKILFTEVTITQGSNWLSNIWSVLSSKEVIPYFLAIIIGIIIFWQMRNLRFWISKGKVQTMEEKAASKLLKATTGVQLWGESLEKLAKKTHKIP